MINAKAISLCSTYLVSASALLVAACGGMAPQEEGAQDEAIGETSQALSGTTHLMPSYALGQCLDPNGAWSGNGNGTTQGMEQTWDCNTAAHPNWTLAQVSTGVYELRSDAGKCMTVWGNNYTNGTQLGLWDCQGQAGSRWTISQRGEFFMLRSYDNFNKCMDVYNWGSTNGTKVQIWDCALNGSNQQFKIPSLSWAFSSSAQWASWASGSYTLYNDIWGSGAGSQTISADSGSFWRVYADHPNTGGIKSYPNASFNANKVLSTIGSCSSSFSVWPPADGAWEATYDIWGNNNAEEIMLWMNHTGGTDGTGNVKPISYNWDSNGNPIPVYTNVTVGGYTWTVFRGNNGANNVYSFLPTSKVTYGTVDVKAIATWIKNQGWFGDITVGQVQFGWEITSSAGGRYFNTQSYSVSCN